MSIWDEVKAKLDILEVIAEYVSISPSGQNYRALSPFKKEKTPSLMISPTKQIWHDFSTGQGGDIFKWVMLMENCTKAEALKKLASKANIKLEQYESSPNHQEETSKKEQGYMVLSWAATTYHSILNKILINREHPVTLYCITRNLKPKTIENFVLGYAPTTSILTKAVLGNPQMLDLCLEIGLVIKTTKGDYKDKFLDRIIIPIHNLDNQIVGFTARILPYDSNPNRPKYLNSAQSLWFDKSSLWFGLARAKKSILQEKKVLLVEGNMDVIAAHQSGLGYTIASQGTSFTDQQLNIIKRFSNAIILAFDSDSAGIQAAQKLFIAATQKGLVVNQLKLPDEFKDVDEWVNSTQEEPTVVVLPYIVHWIEKNYTNLTSSQPAIQRESISQCLDLISYLDSVSQEQYVAKLSALTHIQKSTLLISIPKHTQNTKFVKKDIIQNQPTQSIQELTKLLDQLIVQSHAVNRYHNELEKIFVLVACIASIPMSLEEYKKEHMEHLLVAYENVLSSDFLATTRKVIMLLDTHLPQLLLDATNRDIYIELKQFFTSSGVQQ